MGLVYGLWLAVLGILGAASLIVAKKPNAKELIDKLTPYQGWIGAVSVLGGLWEVINSVLTMGSVLAHWPILWITLLAGAVLKVGLGLLLGVGVLKSFIKDPTAQEKMDQTIVKIAPYQGTMGFVAIGVGIWMVLAGFMWH